MPQRSKAGVVLELAYVHGEADKQEGWESTCLMVVEAAEGNVDVMLHYMDRSIDDADLALEAGAGEMSRGSDVSVVLVQRCTD